MTTMRALLDRAEQYFPANPAVVPLSGAPPLTWAEFVARTRRAAGTLRSLGVEAGDGLPSYAATIRARPS